MVHAEVGPLKIPPALMGIFQLITSTVGYKMSSVVLCQPLENSQWRREALLVTLGYAKCLLGDEQLRETSSIMALSFFQP